MLDRRIYRWAELKKKITGVEYRRDLLGIAHGTVRISGFGLDFERLIALLLAVQAMRNHYSDFPAYRA